MRNEVHSRGIKSKEATVPQEISCCRGNAIREIDACASHFEETRR